MKKVTSLSAGCIVLAIAFIVAYVIALWWATGLLLDWANAHFSLGLNGVLVFILHLLLFALFNAILSVATRSK